jgi:hypothetical protein
MTPIDIFFYLAGIIAVCWLAYKTTRALIAGVFEGAAFTKMVYKNKHPKVTRWTVTKALVIIFFHAFWEYFKASWTGENNHKKEGKEAL